jgi:16S rRNA (cytidine1402-2'-O)-methyltransferase
MLYIVATPIGNLKDISQRALEVLKSCDLIACEDTRHTSILLHHYGIRTPMTSYYQHNRIVKGAYLMEQLREGKSVALVSDAGTPGILDPGYHLIGEAISQGIALTCVPGPSALINALVVSGKPAHTFFFEGFLPPRKGARRNRLEKLFSMECTIVCYESVHRIEGALCDIGDLQPQRVIAVCRELTKKFEEVLRGTAREILSSLPKTRLKGEFVLVL